MSFKLIRYEKQDGIASIRINRPEALNALNSDVNAEIAAVLEEIDADRSVRVLIITGDARAFAAGADITEMAQASPRRALEVSSLAVKINNTLENMSVPTIAAVAGYAFGGGCEMTLACDFRVGGSRTRMSFPEVGLGIIPGANGCVRAVELVGAAKARELIMLTPVITGEEAYKIGLLNRYVGPGEHDELERAALIAKQNLSDAQKTGDEAEIRDAKKTYKDAEAAAAQEEFDTIYALALEIAQALKEKPACALAAAKAAINRAALETVAAGKETEKAEFTLLFDTKDQKEGMAALTEKRKPLYTGC
ncbi:MAG: enoyl-CoA hydratase/isomerase family protein [Oscillospiraceae bacterium]|nr:enoyl-CoA hydratase/isomerase family protein [Oscillospiraceae bacterium]